MNIGGFVALVVAGVLAGLLYELGKILRFVFKNKIVPTVILDFLVSVGCGAMFVFAEFTFCNLALSGYSFVGFIAGIILERTTLGFLLAKNMQSVYNWLTRIGKRAKTTKFLKRVFK